MDLKYISYEIKENICVVHVTTSGYLNLEIGEEVLKLCKELVDSGNKKLLLNLSLTKMVNSIGVSMLIEVIEYLEEKDGELAFCCMKPIVEKTFKIMGLSNYATLFETQDDGLTSNWK